MATRAIVTRSINPTDYKEGDDYSKQFKVVKTAKNYIVIGRTFKNGKVKKMSEKYIFAK